MGSYCSKWNLTTHISGVYVPKVGHKSNLLSSWPDFHGHPSITTFQTHTRFVAIENTKDFLLTEPPFNTPENRELMAEMMSGSLGYTGCPTFEVLGSVGYNPNISHIYLGYK